MAYPNVPSFKTLNSFATVFMIYLLLNEDAVFSFPINKERPPSAHTWVMFTQAEQFHVTGGVLPVQAH